MGQVCGRGTWDSCAYTRSKNLMNVSSLLPCFCVSLYILPDVVMSVCRRCVEGVAMEMGGKEGIWEESVGQNEAKMLLNLHLRQLIYYIYIYRLQMFSLCC